jgi:hypothetical protein
MEDIMGYNSDKLFERIAYILREGAKTAKNTMEIANSLGSYVQDGWFPLYTGRLRPLWAKKLGMLAYISRTEVLLQDAKELVARHESQLQELKLEYLASEVSKSAYLLKSLQDSQVAHPEYSWETFKAYQEKIDAIILEVESFHGL